MKSTSSKAHATLLKGLTLSAIMFTFLVTPACDSVAVRTVLEDVLDDGDPQTKLVVSENGAVLASGPVEMVARKSFDLAGVTFAVTSETNIIDRAGASLALTDLEVGTALEVDGTQHSDGSFEASFAEITKALSSSASVTDDDDDGDDGSDSLKVIICHVPPGNPDNARTKSVGPGAAAAHLAHGDYEGECVEDPVDGGEVEEGDDANLEDDGEEGQDDDSVKVVICHIPPGNPDNAKTKSVDADDVQDHLDHGDYEGECTGDEGGTGDRGNRGGNNGGDGDGDGDGDDDGEEKVVICHIPPGNPDNAKTKSVGLDDLQDHLDHGDYEGECVDPEDTGGD